MPETDYFLGVPNQQLVHRFIAKFARAEYAIKRSGFVSSHPDRADPEWDRFASKYEKLFAEAPRSAEVDEAVRFLLESPPRKQIAPDRRLGWTDSQRTNEPELKWLLLLVRRARNNLFHGGKYPTGPVIDESRSIALLQAALTLLEHVMLLDRTVSSFFEAPT